MQVDFWKHIQVLKILWHVMLCNFIISAGAYLRFLFGDELNCHFVKKKKKKGGLGGEVGETEQHQLEGFFWEKMIYTSQIFGFFCFKSPDSHHWLQQEATI